MSNLQLRIYFDYKIALIMRSRISTILLFWCVAKSRIFTNFIVEYILKLHAFHHFLIKIRTFKSEFEFRQTSKNHLWFWRICFVQNSEISKPQNVTFWKPIPGIRKLILINPVFWRMSNVFDQNVHKMPDTQKWPQKHPKTPKRRNFHKLHRS